MSVSIAVESPLQDEIRALVAELDATLNASTPLEHNYPLTVEQMAEPSMTVYVARENGRAIGCGALKRHADGIGEIKRMFTVPQARGRGIGGRIVAEIEAQARREGMTQLVLETGDKLAAAWHVYERAGFRRCGAVLDYPDTKWSVFFKKSLSLSEAAA